MLWMHFVHAQETLIQTIEQCAAIKWIKSFEMGLFVVQAAAGGLPDYLIRLKAMEDEERDDH